MPAEMEMKSEGRMNRLSKALQSQRCGPILGAAAYFYDPIFLEISSRLGFRAAWIEMEHGFITFAQAADLCRIAQGLGMLTMIRVADTRRESVMKAAECGPDILDVPMANSPEDLHELIRYARFPPAGERGYFGVSRAVHYGIECNVAEVQQELNQEMCLMAQIETSAGVENAEVICAVPDVDIFLGPADLSASLGVPGQTGHERVCNAASLVIRTARKYGKHVAVGAAPQDLSFWAEQGVDLLFCINNVAAMRYGAAVAMQQAREAVERAAQRVSGT